MITVLHTESSRGWGGQENRTLNEALGLSARGARVLILCQPDARLKQRAEEKGIPVFTVPMRSSFDARAVRFMQKIIRQERVDVVNTHSGRDGILAGLAARLSRRRPAIVRTRHLALPITSRLSYVWLADRIVTVSAYVGQYLAGRGIAPEKIIVIPTGIDTAERFNPDKAAHPLRQELGLADTAPLVGTVAILRAKKGHLTLLQAIPRVLQAVPDALFVFAGDGPQLENIERVIAELGLQGKVRLLGLRRDIPDVLNSLDLFVLPTLQEALGTSFVEAMAMGKPVIGSRVGGVPEVIRDGENGFLAPPGDPEALAARIIDLLTDPARARRMGQTGRQLAEQQFSLGHMCDAMLSLYCSLPKARD